MRPSPHRATIAHLVDEGCSAAEIARRLHINDRTVRRIVAQYRERGHHLPLPKSGRPRTVNVPRIRKVIKKRISRNDEVSMNKIASDLHISRRSVQNIVKCELDFHSYRFFRGQMLSEAAKKNRLEKCQKLLAVRAGRLSDIVWTDEKIFTVEVAHNSQNQRQLLPRAEKNSRKRRVKTRSLFPKSVMVWAGITSEGKTPLVFVDKNIKINSETYQNVILRDTRLPWARNHFGERNFVLQQDWASAHGSKSTISFCRHHFPGFWDKDMWPSNSPDLNPMDYSVWSYLQQKVSSSPHRSLDSLKAASQMEWQKIDVDYLRPTVEAFTKRLEACILARGDHFEQYLE
uniref:DDE_3 domain-containing protein n=1 Tax=Haemonchus contortus TaxID=6289 RepID=A0A7I5E7H4_HAECO